MKVLGFLPPLGCSVLVASLTNTQTSCPTVSHLEPVTLLKPTDLSCPKLAHPLNPVKNTKHKPTMPNQKTPGCARFSKSTLPETK